MLFREPITWLRLLLASYQHDVTCAAPFVENFDAFIPNFKKNLKSATAQKIFGLRLHLVRKFFMRKIGGLVQLLCICLSPDCGKISEQLSVREYTA